MKPVRHFMKVHPFVVRLNAATGALNNAINQHNTEEIARGLEDVGFWTARTVAEMISAADDNTSTPSHIRIFQKGMATVFKAQAANVKARKALETLTLPGAQGEIPTFTSKPDVNESMKMSAGLIGGPLLVLASGETSGKWATALVLSGSAISAWSLWKWLQHR